MPNVEHEHFIFLLMSTIRVSQKERRHIYMKLSEKIAKKRDQHYSVQKRLQHSSSLGQAKYHNLIN